MKKHKIIFWVTTGFLFLFEGVMPALTFNSEMAKEGITHLGYPLYFGTTLAVFKVLGAICLIVPQVPKRLKELAYAGFAFDFLFATISHLVVDGFNFQSLFPLIVLAILVVSYFSFQKLNNFTKNVAA
jgi:hypothetical protein